MSYKMSSLLRPDGTTIKYTILGKGPINVLLLARGGMRSSVAMWRGSSWNPLTRLQSNNNDENENDDTLSKKFTLIAMDQRYSVSGSLPDNHNTTWQTYRDDQISLLNHLNIQKCHLLGSCIGPSYALQLLKDYPNRFDKAVLLQPIGLAEHTTEPIPWVGTNAGAEKEHWFGDWAAQMLNEKRASQHAINKLYNNMFGRPDHYDFCFTVKREEMKNITHPLLVFCGRDVFHPAKIAREIAELAPNAILVEEWRDVGEEKMREADSAIKDFLLSSV